MKPSPGRIVHYTVSEHDAASINAQRDPARSNPASEGDVYPALIVRTFGDTEGAAANLQVFYDGAAASYWATSRTEAQHVPGDLGTWHQPPRV